MIFNCPKCSEFEEISLDECFKDKAAENELKTATIMCSNQDCPWEGPGKFYMVLILMRKSTLFSANLCCCKVWYDFETWARVATCTDYYSA